MTYADTDDLQLYYDKVGTAFALFQPTIDDGDFTALPQENRIVGPLSDTRSIINIRLVEQLANGKTVIEATTRLLMDTLKSSTSLSLTLDSMMP